jgi:hypothetical protein
MHGVRELASTMSDLLPQSITALHVPGRWGQVRRAVLRHLFPVAATTLAVAGAWIGITLPLVAVFMMDEGFNLNEYLMFVVYAFGVGAGISLLILLPVGLILEAFVKRHKLFAIAPIVLAGLAGGWLIARILITKQVFDSVFGWAGLTLFLCVLLGFYWTVLWMVRGIVYAYTRYRRRNVGAVLPTAKPSTSIQFPTE